MKPGYPGPIRQRKQPLIGGPAPQPCRPRPWNRPSGPREKQLEGMPMAIGKPPGLTPLEGSVLAVNDAIRIGGFLLWGLAGLALGKSRVP